jgi:hypothetical protein
VKNGTVYEGIFHTLQIENKDAHLVLKYAKVVTEPSAQGSEKVLDVNTEKPIPTLVIYSNDIVQMLVKDVKLNAEDLASTDRTDFGFETDSAISRGRAG